MWSIVLLSLALAQAAVSGVITDSSGGAVPGATIVVRTSAGDQEQAVSGSDGRFTLETVPPGATIVVRAGGFAIKEVTAAALGNGAIVLEPASLLDTVTVTPTRSEQRLGDVPASVSVIDRAQIEESPALVADDVLRRVPTFSLFRRTNSLAAHPTAQGVSLRGVGPSGVSRTLVLIDNVPFNDPFGGWVYWTRVPLESVERIEVVDGSGSSLYGNYAMGGVINVVSSRPTRRTADIRTQYGNRDSKKLDFFGSDVWGKVGAAVEGSLFDTDGYPQVRADERGPVDTNARVDFRNFSAKIDYNPTARTGAFVRVGYFREQRDNAKVSTFDGSKEANDTTWRTVSGGARFVLPDQSDLQARVFGDFETFTSNFLAVPNPQTRAIGRMTLLQRVPTKGFGGMVQWARALGARHYVTAGTDWRWVDGDSEEKALDAVTGATVTLERISGGTQRSVGAFVQDLFTPIDRMTVTLSARVDRWRNYDAHNFETTVATGLPTANSRELPDRDDTVASPRAAVMYRLSDRVNAWGSIGSGFRAPTLNELYRQFRVGAILTLANDQLGPERLIGGEAGLNLAPTSNLTIRSTWFDNRVRNPVSNVTRLDLVNTQQRQNLGRTRIWGIQTDAEYRFGSMLRVSGGYLYNQARVRESSASPMLVGTFLPQVPEHRGSAQVSYANPRLATLALGVQVFGRQFDDDLNTRVVPGESDPGLPRYAVVDFTAMRQILPNVGVFFGAQNLFDQEFIVQTLPTTVGAPRLIHAGIKVNLSRR